ncbi:MAG: alpha/beta hydrolase [Acidobacteria bacterium]|nr:alpha/beta hydrolase [Acidobacteriota bacterium]
MRPAWALLCAAALCRAEEGLVYGEAGGEILTMDYYPAAGKGPHPAAILIHGGGFVGGNSKNPSEAYCADFLAPAGYAVFSINYRLAPRHPYPAMVEDVERAVRFIRYNARRWDVDPGRVALVGGSAGGWLSNLAGVRKRRAIPGASDPVDRASARVQAVVTLYGPSDFRNRELGGNLKALLGPLAEKKGVEAALAEASPVMHITGEEPPFLLIHGDQDATVPIAQSTHLQAALKAGHVRCDLIIIRGGGHGTGRWHKVPGVAGWEREMTEWLNLMLRHKGPVGEGIRPRAPEGTTGP